MKLLFYLQLFYIKFIVLFSFFGIDLNHFRYAVTLANGSKTMFGPVQIMNHHH